MYLTRAFSTISLLAISVATYVKVDSINNVNVYNIYEPSQESVSYVFHDGSLDIEYSSHIGVEDIQIVDDEGDPLQSLLQDSSDLLFNDAKSYQHRDEALKVSEVKDLESNTDNTLESFDSASQSEPLVITTEVKVESGDSLIRILRSNGMSGSDTTSLIYRSGVDKKAFDISIGDSIRILKDSDDIVTSIEIVNSRSGFHVLTSDGDLWLDEFVEFDIESRLEWFSFDLNRSLFIDAESAGMRQSEIAKFQEVFMHTVNFSRLRAGTRFSVLLKRNYQNNSVTGNSILKVGKIEYRGAENIAYMFDDGDSVNYYDESGNSLLPSFRRYPLDEVRITSHFNPNRPHPVLKGVVRPHRGVDFGGNGKSIKAIGDGVIEFAGKRGAFGNVVIIDHGHNIKTLSAHQSRFHSGIRTGGTVSKGDVIGYVGSTGLVTGPHLHFELSVDGTHVNPLTYPLPMSSEVSSTSGFTEAVEAYNKQISILGS
ncbi:putative Uncharacterized metalloprotease HI_0409 [Vibrio chagasii]|nr:putative Uncharacterized metalloprotease HI_0409 [Vibrio chagasii]